MAVNEHILLSRWFENRDAEAFKDLAMAHAAMVHRTCRRILGNAHDAEEVAQECFEDLARTMTPPRVSLGGWLHRVATFKAINRLKSERRRQDREERYSRERDAAGEPPWEEVYRHVDASLAVLPDKYRAPIVLNFFENQTHADIAVSLDVSRGTVTYRIKKGVEALRKDLRRRGIAMGAAALTAGLAMEGSGAMEIPGKLVERIGHMALAARTGTTAGGYLMTGKWLWLTAVIGAIAVTGAVVKLSMNAEEPAPVPAPNVSAPAPAMPAPRLDDSGEKALRPAAASRQAPQPMEVAAAVVEDPPPSEPQLDGFWEAHLDTGGEQSTMRVVIEQAAYQVTVREPDGAFTLAGRLVGNNLTVVDVEEPPSAEFAGTFAQDWKSATFTGWFASPDGSTEEVSARIERLPAEEQMAGAATESRREEVEAMCEPLFAYSAAHGGFPGALEDLVPRYAADLEAFANTGDRKVSYHPARDIEGTGVDTAVPPVDDGSGIPFPDRLMAHEAQLRKAWGGTFPNLDSFLRVAYEEPPQSFSVRQDGVFENEAPGNQSQVRASCQENLKHLLLVSKMFENENGYTVPGWYTVFPRYLVDPLLLTCQAQPPGTDSYEILFPATHVDFLTELYETVTGETAERHVCFSQVPLIVERQEHGGGAAGALFGTAGRNVAFADGHVEFLTTQAWETKVAPYLAYR